jgi:hypothetical protein
LEGVVKLHDEWAAHILHDFTLGFCMNLLIAAVYHLFLDDFHCVELTCDKTMDYTFVRFFLDKQDLAKPSPAENLDYAEFDTLIDWKSLMATNFRRGVRSLGYSFL